MLFYRIKNWFKFSLKNNLKEFKKGFCNTKAIDIKFINNTSNKFWFSLGYLLWGYDIFLNKIPFLKSFILVNILIWVIFWIIK